MEEINSNKITGVEKLPDFEKIEHGQIFSIALSNKTNSSTHGLHRFAAKFIPQIPGWALAQFADKKSVVLDPFAGSGTTLVEAIGNCATVIGADIDPLARLISRAKTTDLNLQVITPHIERLKEASISTAKNLSVPIEGVDNFDHWFSEETWGKLQSIKETLETIDCPESVRDFFLCVFSSIIREVSNADNQSHKTYVSGTLKKQPKSVDEIFPRRLDAAVNKISTLHQNMAHRTEVNILDATAQSLEIKSNTVDLIVTSPPYLDSVDYMYNFMLEYFWLAKNFGIRTRKDFNNLRKLPIGAKNPKFVDELHSEMKSRLKLENSISDTRKNAIIEYYVQMRAHFKEASRVLKNDGRYVLVIGNSKSNNQILPVHDTLINLASEFGLYIEKAFGYRIRRHYMKFPRQGRGGIILVDWVITLKKSKSDCNVSKSLPLPDISLGDNEVAN